MRALIAVGLIVLSSPAFAANCPYVNDTGDRVTFVDDGENTVTVVRTDGTKTTCSWGVTGEIMPYEDIACADGTKAGFFFGSPMRSGNNQNLLIWGEDIYYRDCSPGVGL